MFSTRRAFFTTFGAFVLTACGTTPPRARDVRADALPPDLLPQPNAAFDAWVTNFRPRALSNGISASTYDRAFQSAGFLPGVIARDGNQIQTRRTFEDYLSIATSDERVTKGRAAFAQYSATLTSIENRFGVESHILAAIWGMESTYGERMGQIPVISSTATLAFDGRRAGFFEAQLLAALRILENGDTTPENLTGSWAGAMGHTQFIPTTYQSAAVDFDGDGRRDIWSPDPTDALAGTANYLASNGWRRGVPWGAEEGTSNLQGRALQPQAGGVRFTVTRNFNVLKTYNNSDFYAAAVGHLSDRIAGGGPLQGGFPPDANGLTREDRIAIQTGLQRRGYDIGTIDGVIGPATEAAISAFQQAAGLPVTGLATRDVLAALR
ncbi:MAG: lytic murein transglycosylase [Pseudomonadota bacterium]